jgi:UDP-N-acetylglucosamine--N-acetylmuramyl-(pentapeptide) pyrophosphoryl-undecaprenol N-acetylglucosamine transferase
VKVAVTGGGTGGHILPVLAVIKSLRKIDPDVKIFFIGSRFGLESQLIPKMGVKYYGISTGKFRRYHKSKILNIIDPTTIYNNTKDFFRFLKGIREARTILAHEKPDVIFAKGGYVSLPVGYAAKFSKTPLVIHESDTIMGMANQKMSKYAKKVAVTFPTSLFPEVDPEIISQTGNPVREDLLGVSREEGQKSLGFNKDIKTLLVIGGSQGSQFINDNIFEIAEELLSEIQIIWIAGERDAEIINYKIKDYPENISKNLKLFGFVTSEMANLYAAADLAVTRPGSNILFELAALNKPAILIPPSKNIAGGHQFQNARYFSRNGASLVIKQPDVTPKKLAAHIKRLLNDEEELGYMAKKMNELSIPDAADQLSEIIYQVGEKHIVETRKAKTE